MIDPIISFFVPGIPAPGGSKRAFVGHRKDGSHYANVVDAGGERTKNWRANVAFFAAQALSPFRGILFDRGIPFLLQIRFVMPRPRSHYRMGKAATLLRPDAPRYHTSKPDATKLLRSTEDALTGILWHDDSAAMPRVWKEYGEAPGAEITLYEMEPRVSRSQEKRIAIESGAELFELAIGGVQ